MPHDIPLRASWDDLERAARDSVPIYRLVASVRAGDITKEQALIHTVLWFNAEREAWMQREVERLKREPGPGIVT